LAFGGRLELSNGEDWEAVPFEGICIGGGGRFILFGGGTADLLMTVAMMATPVPPRSPSYSSSLSLGVAVGSVLSPLPNKCAVKSVSQDVGREFKASHERFSRLWGFARSRE
jgi:hypothetical protein